MDYPRDEAGGPLAVEGLWGLLFGNGEALGDSTALHFTAGPEDEKDALRACEGSRPGSATV